MEVRNDLVLGYTRSEGGHYGYNKLDYIVGEQKIEEPRALINRTRFPSRTTILDQVYQLIGNELKIVFGDKMGWR
jgi:hypothetical protein